MTKEACFIGAGNVELYERRSICDGEPLANVILLHGFGDHCSRYAWVMEQFREANINVFTYDQRGHGHSPGKRAYVERFEDFLDDLERARGHFFLGGRFEIRHEQIEIRQNVVGLVFGQFHRSCLLKRSSGFSPLYGEYRHLSPKN